MVRNAIRERDESIVFSSVRHTLIQSDKPVTTLTTKPVAVPLDGPDRPAGGSPTPARAAGVRRAGDIG